MSSTSGRSTEVDPGGQWPRRTGLEILSDQLSGIDAWNAANSARAGAERAATLTREMRLDLSRRMHARRQEQQALLERARQHMERSAALLAVEHAAPRAVVVHRNAWLRATVVEGLEERGVQVVAVLEDGAQAAGALVVEQPADSDRRHAAAVPVGPAVRRRHLTGHAVRCDRSSRVIVGVGVDVVDVGRLERALARTPQLVGRLFTPAEQVTAGRDRAADSLAARFAAKEAVAKALGAPGGLRWVDAEVVSAGRGRPVLRVHGGVADEAVAQGIRTWHLSLSHDAGVATAIVVAES